MFSLTYLTATLVGLLLAIVSLLLAIWWRQQSFRWPFVLLVCLVASPLLSWWSGLAFEVADYRAGCDGLCPGYRGAPVSFFYGQAAGGDFLPAFFAVNCLVYLLLLLAWSAIGRSLMRRAGANARNPFWSRALLGLLLLISPFALSPFYLPPAQAHVRGDPQRIAINAEREVYLYDHLAAAPIARVGLVDVRPRRDGQPGMRVCLRLYTYFYLPVGYMYLDMTPEGVHSNAGGVLPRDGSCWE